VLESSWTKVKIEIRIRSPTSAVICCTAADEKRSTDIFPAAGEDVFP